MKVIKLKQKEVRSAELQKTFTKQDFKDLQLEVRELSEEITEMSKMVNQLLRLLKKRFAEDKK